MPPPPLLSAAAFLILLAAAGTLPTSLAQPGSPSFPGCDRTFSCGNVRNLTYPFTGGNRPDYCGPPEFRLTCPDTNNIDQVNYPELTSNSSTYRVVNIDPTRQTLTLARLDLWDTTCPSTFVNSTPDSRIFVTSEDDNIDLTLFFNCNSTTIPIQPQNQFRCDAGVVGFPNSYYLIGPVPSDPILSIVLCLNGVRIPLLRTAGDALSANEITLGEALTRGFIVSYTDPYSNRCSECSRSGGQCGFNTTTNQPICICGNRICFPPGDSKKNGSLPIVLPIVGAVLAGVGIGWGIFVCRQRRKKRIEAASAVAAQTSSKDTAFASKGLSTTPSSNFTTSIPSYPSSRTTTEFGKSTYFGAQVFSYEELEIATDNFDTSRELGDGGFGTVYYGKLIDGREVAVKRLYENNFKRVEQFLNEVEILTRLNHGNLVKLYGCTSKRSRELLLVYEYIANGTVADHLHGKLANPRSGLLTWSVRLNIAIETADALAYLHQSDIIHRDVKTNNILLDKNFRVKVADFGLSRLFPNDATHVSTAPQGTPGYVDPEYYQCYQLTDKSDVYSFGVVLIELISSLQAVDTNRHRHDINLANMAINKIQNHTLDELVDKSNGFENNPLVRRMTTLVAELAFRCLQQEKDMRPTMKEVLETLRGIQNEEHNSQKPEVLDIVVDDGALLKDNHTDPPSPDSGVTDKLVESSVPNSSSG